MIDLPLVAIALAVIVIVAVVSFFLFFGTRERSFEDALAERKGLNILLSSDADDHKKVTKEKEPKKKAKPATMAKKIEPKSRSEEPRTEQETEEKGVIERPTVSPLQAPRNIGPVDTASSSEQESIDVGRKSNAKKPTKPEQSDQKLEVVDKIEKRAAVAQETRQNGSLKTTNSELAQNLANNVESTAVEAVVILSKNAQLNADNVSHAPEVPKKKKVKPKAAPKNVDLESQPGKGFDTTDDEISINATLRRLNLAVLSEMQQDVIAEFYSNNGPWATKPFSKPGAQTAAPAEIISLGQLRKQIEEKEALLAKETQKLASTSQMLKDAKQETLHEKERSAANERSFKEKVSSLQNEIQSMSQKLIDFQSQMNSKGQTYRQMEAQLMQFRLEQNNMAQLQQENQRIKEHVSSIEQEVLARKSELQRVKQEVLNRDNQIHLLEQQMKENDQIRAELERCQKELQDARNSYNASMLNQQRVEEAKNELQRKLLEADVKFTQSAQVKDSEIKKLMGQLDCLSKETTALKSGTESADLKGKEMEESLNNKNKLESEISQLKSDLQCSLKKLDEKTAKFSSMETDFVATKQSLALAQKEIDDLKAELQTKIVFTSEAGHNAQRQTHNSPGTSTNDVVSTSGKKRDHVTETTTASAAVDADGDNADDDDDGWVTFTWQLPPSGATTALPTDVALMSDINNWEQPIQMHHKRLASGRQAFVARLQLVPGSYQFKFVVDGVWQCSPDYDMCERPDGVVNNVMSVRGR